MNYILDTSFFFGDYILEGELFTSPEVTAEVKDTAARMRLEVRLSQGLIITGAEPEAVAMVQATAEKSGDARVLSGTDISVIALSLSLSGTVVSDDFAVQNVCRHLRIPVRNLLQRTAKKRTWKKICSGCGAEIQEGNECLICGAQPLRRKTERKSGADIRARKR